ncbi:MAG: triose-phosphate isomerase [Spartobacteria bacterium]|nr:triose-phosphate isomerase [Spartobacteria bacterium]
MRKTIIAGNWKMNKTIADAVALIEDLKKVLPAAPKADVVVCPVFTALKSVSDAAKGSAIKVGGQDLYWEKSGAFTGEISWDMLKDAGCDYVIIGHSERRQFFGETDETVNKKTKAALANGLIPIVCVGEMLEDREAGNTEKVVEAQVRGGLVDISAEDMEKIVIAYEPVWAIGTGKVATPQQAQDVHAFTRGILADMFSAEVADKVRIQYGGSMKAENAKELLSQPDIDGGLIGGAALKADSFVAIINAAE